ncbi:MAG: hypothetical protein MJ224_07170 [archaeon]|nr:hypothetical protein [archaeon]
MNNQTKKPMTFWRVQEDHFLDSTNVGDVVDFRDLAAVSVSKEAALFFSESNSKPMKYILEFEVPEGVNGAFIAPIKKGTKYVGGEKVPLTHEMEALLRKHKVEIRAFGDKTMKGLLGEDLIHIKLRVVG